MILISLEKLYPMKQTLSLVALFLISFGSFAQMRSYDQVSIEADYGFNGTTHHKTLTGINHFGVGFRYMVDEYWGVKFDYANDRFRLDADGDSKQGTNYNRFSLQAVHNLGRTLDIPWNTMDRLNLLVHAGVGYSAMKSLKNPGIDNMGHVIFGITPQVFLSESLAFHIDASYIVNFTQHFNFDGTYPTEAFTGDRPGFTAGMFTASAGLTIYLGRSKSNADWR